MNMSPIGLDTNMENMPISASSSSSGHGNPITSPSQSTGRGRSQRQVKNNGDQNPNITPRKSRERSPRRENADNNKKSSVKAKNGETHSINSKRPRVNSDRSLFSRERLRRASVDSNKKSNARAKNDETDDALNLAEDEENYSRDPVDEEMMNNNPVAEGEMPGNDPLVHLDAESIESPEHDHEISEGSSVNSRAFLTDPCRYQIISQISWRNNIYLEEKIDSKVYAEISRPKPAGWTNNTGRTPLDRNHVFKSSEFDIDLHEIDCLSMDAVRNVNCSSRSLKIFEERVCFLGKHTAVGQRMHSRKMSMEPEKDWDIGDINDFEAFYRSKGYPLIDIGHVISSYSFGKFREDNMRFLNIAEWLNGHGVNIDPKANRYLYIEEKVIKMWPHYIKHRDQIAKIREKKRHDEIELESKKLLCTGKHKGKTFAYVHKNENEYVSNLIKQTRVLKSTNLIDFKKYVEMVKRHEGTAMGNDDTDTGVELTSKSVNDEKTKLSDLPCDLVHKIATMNRTAEFAALAGTNREIYTSLFPPGELKLKHALDFCSERRASERRDQQSRNEKAEASLALKDATIAALEADIRQRDAADTERNANARQHAVQVADTALAAARNALEAFARGDEEMMNNNPVAEGEMPGNDPLVHLDALLNQMIGIMRQ